MSAILVLEDDRELNQTITYGLEKEGYRVFSAYSCKDAEGFTEKEAFELAIMDVPNEVTAAAIEEGRKMISDPSSPRYSSMDALEAALEV